MRPSQQPIYCTFKYKFISLVITSLFCQPPGKPVKGLKHKKEDLLAGVTTAAILTTGFR